MLKYYLYVESFWFCILIDKSTISNYLLYEMIVLSSIKIYVFFLPRLSIKNSVLVDLNNKYMTFILKSCKDGFDF